MAALFLVIGCNRAEDEPAPAATPAGEAAADPDPAPADTPDPDPVADDPETIYPVRIVQPGHLRVGSPEGLEAVNAQLLTDGFNIEVDIIRIPWDVYEERLNLMLATGEEFEMLHVMSNVRNISSFAGIGAIMSLEGLLDDFPDLVNRFTEVEWASVLWNGERYAVPSISRTLDNLMSYMTVRSDTMRQVGWDTFPGHSLDELIELMLAMQEEMLQETGIRAHHWMHWNADNPNWLHRTYDSFPFHVEDDGFGLVLIRQDGTVESFYESEEFRMNAEFYRRLFLEGLIHPDALSLDHMFRMDHAQMGAFLPSQTFEITLETAIPRLTGLEGVTIEQFRMAPEKPELIFATTRNTNAVSSTARNPAAPLMFLDWLYTSQFNHDLFHLGIEGVHWHDLGNNRHGFERDAGGDMLYYMGQWMTGYVPFMRFEADIPQGHIDSLTFRATNYAISPILGFMFDPSNVIAEITNLQVELIASIYPIKFGIVPFEDNIDTAIANLRAAGLDRYLEEYRRQFEEHLANNPHILEMAMRHAQ